MATISQLIGLISKRRAVGANEFGQVEGAVQYRLEKILDENYFVKTKPIGEKVQ